MTDDGLTLGEVRRTFQRIERSLERVERKVEQSVNVNEFEKLKLKVEKIDAVLGHFANPDVTRQFLEEWQEVRGQLHVLRALAAYRRWLWVGGLGGASALALTGLNLYLALRGHG